MTVKELKELIESLPDEMLVVLQKDSEGNGYSPLAGDDNCMYIPENTWSGYVYEEDELEEDDIEDAIFSLVLYPIN